jgi:hypothetical protein
VRLVHVSIFRASIGRMSSTDRYRTRRGDPIRVRWRAAPTLILAPGQIEHGPAAARAAASTASIVGVGISASDGRSTTKSILILQ